MHKKVAVFKKLVQVVFFSIIFITSCFSALSYTPRIFLDGYAGNNLLGQADVLAPILLGSDSNLFVYAEGRYSYDSATWASNPRTLSLGLGYRHIIANNLWGLYVLGDYTRSSTNKYAYIVSPGIESLGQNWDFRINGYFPIGTKDWKTEFWADQLGDYSHVRYSGHEEYDYMYIFHEEIGPGADAEIGRKLFSIDNVLVKGFLGGYFFHFRFHKNMNGGEARITIQPTSYLQLSLNDTYDNYRHNEFLAGIQISLYDLINNSNVNDIADLHRRLFDPIERNFASSGSGDTAVFAGSPDEGKPDDGDDGGNDKPKPKPEPEPERDNIWFFDATNFPLTLTSATTITAEDGTYEHPFTADEFNQSTVDGIYAYSTAHSHDGALFYFNSGTYRSYTAGTPYAPIMLHPEQSMWGREGGPKGFLAPATNPATVEFLGSLKLNNETSINDLKYKNDLATTGLTTGITADNVTDTEINHAIIGENSDNAGYEVGVLNKDVPVSIKDTSINAYSSANNAVGLKLEDLANISLGDNNSVNGTSVAANGIALELSNSPTVAIGSNNNFTGASTNANGIGLQIDPNISGNIIFNDFIGDGTSVFNGVSDVAGYGLYAVSSTGTVILHDIKDFTFDGSFAGTAGTGSGINISAVSGISVDDIDNVTSKGRVNGIYTYTNSGSIVINSISNSTLQDSTAPPRGFGLYGDANGSDITINSIDNSHFYGKGTADGYGAELSGKDITINEIKDSLFSSSNSNNGNGFSALATNDISLLNIENSSFDGSNIGLEVKSTGAGGEVFIGPISDASKFTAFRNNSTGADIESDGNITIYNISGNADTVADRTTFSGEQTGMKVTSTSGDISMNAIGDYAEFSSDQYGLDLNAKDITITGISNSIFSGDVSNGGYGLRAVASGNVNIGVTNNITHSTFTGTALGFSVDNTGGTGTISLGDISNNSRFTASGNNSSGMELLSTKDITVQNISDSTFSAAKFGLNVDSSGGQVSIANISGSDFTGTAGNNGKGLFIKSNNVLATIGNILNSSFDGGDNSLEVDSGNSGTATIGNITDTTIMIATQNSDRGIVLTGSTVIVNGSPVTTGNDAFAALTGPIIFSPDTIGKRLCVNGSCY